MITLTFLVCIANGQCVQQAPQATFQTITQCETMAKVVMDDMDRKMAEGVVPAHTSTFRCVQWGTPS